MINRSLRGSALLVGTLIIGAFAAPAFGQSYGAVPRGPCAKAAPVAAAPVTTAYQQPVAHDAGDDAAPVRQTQRPRRARGFGSPF